MSSKTGCIFKEIFPAFPVDRKKLGRIDNQVKNRPEIIYSQNFKYTLSCLTTLITFKKTEKAIKRFS